MTVSDPLRLPLDLAAVRRSVAEIADALAPVGPVDNVARANALAGATLFFAHLGQVSGEDGHRRAAIEAAARTAEAVAGVPMGPRLFGGLAGMAWPLAHLERLGIVDEAIDLGDVDEALVEGVREDVTAHFDLISGVVGLGVYFLERMPAPAAVEGLRRVVHRLQAMAERDERGMRWRTTPALVPALQQAGVPEGKYDLGVAHGIPGVIALLALALLNGAERHPAEGMLRDAVRWLVALQRPDAREGAYGTVVDVRSPDTMRPGSRAAWCYGDPGIAAALLLAARALDDDALSTRAHALAHGAAALAQAQRHRVVDTSLCHGSAGLAHLFGVLAGATGAAPLRAHARGWHAVTLAMRRPGEGIAGFYFAEYRDGAPRRSPDASLLQGAPGVGLSLLGALDPSSDRSWDRLLLLG